MILRPHNPYRRATQSLQGELGERGVDPGPVDGRYGGRTEAAVKRFQTDAGLMVDGIAGPQTFRALSQPPLVPFDPWAYLYLIEPAHLQPIFPEVPFARLRMHLPQVLRGLERSRLMYQPMFTIAMATIRAETAGFEPLSEQPNRFNTSPEGPPFDLYDARQDLGNEGRPDGARFRGRGFVQLTGRDNYRVYGHRIGIDLESDPDRANEPRLAGLILGAFLKDRERRLVRYFESKDMVRMRRLVNGGAHGLERFAAALEVSMDPFCDALEQGCGCLF